MNREVHVRFCEGLGVRFPRATRLNLSSGFPVTCFCLQFVSITQKTTRCSIKVLFCELSPTQTTFSHRKAENCQAHLHTKTKKPKGPSPLKLYCRRLNSLTLPIFNRLPCSIALIQRQIPIRYIDNQFKLGQIICVIYEDIL